MKTRDEIVSLVNHEIASAHLVQEHIEIAYKLGYIQGQNDKENELESESEPTDEGLQALADLGKSNLSRFLPRRPDDVPAELAAELTALKEEVRQARRQWIGDDAGHLPLAEAIEFVRDRDRAELAALVRELREALDFVMIEYVDLCDGVTDFSNRDAMEELLKKSEGV